MGLFDEVRGAVFQAAEGTAQSVLAQAVSSVTSGGIGGLLSTLQQNGLGEHVASWLSSGEKFPPISADQLRSVLGDAHISQIAQSMGLPVDQISEALAEHLPALAAAHKA